MDRVDEIASIYGVSRRELTIGQIEDFFLEELKNELGLGGEKGETFRKGFKTQNININNPIHKVCEKGEVIGGGKGKNPERFSKPTVEDIRAYCQERKNNVDPERFYDFYESKGWVIGRNGRMKDWKAAVRNWERNTPSRTPQKPKSRGFDNFEERNTDYDALFGGEQYDR